MADIFISYASQDRDRVELLAKALAETHGWSVWWDRDVPCGKPFDQVIEEALKSARCIIVAWSTNAVKSHWVIEEAEVGRDRDILVPVLLDDVAIPLGFRRLQAANMVDWNGKTTGPVFDKLLSDISASIGAPPNGLLPMTFSSLYAASPDIKVALDKYIRRVSKPQVRVLGLVLQYQWPILEGYLRRILSEPYSGALKHLDIKVALLDPDWSYTGTVNNSFPNDARGNIERIRQFCSSSKKQINGFSWSLELFTFQYVAHWVGILIGDDLLFLGRSYWEDSKRLRGGQNTVVMVTRGVSALETEIIDEFRGWFLYSQQKKEAL